MRILCICSYGLLSLQAYSGSLLRNSNPFGFLGPGFYRALPWSLGLLLCSRASLLEIKKLLSVSLGDNHPKKILKPCQFGSGHSP